jgi:hypothetical protein
MSPNTIKPKVVYNKLFDSNSIEATAMSKMPLVPELKESYDRMLTYLEKLFRERFKKIREVLYKLHSGLSAEDAINSYLLSKDETMKSIGLKKYQEILDNTLASEREAYIERLAHEITILNEKVLLAERKSNQDKAQACIELEQQNKKLRLQIMNSKKSIDELKTLNEKTLNQLEEKNRQLVKFQNEVKHRNRDSDRYDRQNMETLKRENSILATQLRDMQDELAENSNISKIQTKNASSLEISNNILSDR